MLVFSIAILPDKKSPACCSCQALIDPISRSQAVPEIANMDAFTPQQTTELVSRIGTKKSHMRLDKLLFNSMLSGPLLGFGCAVMTSTETAPWYQENAPGLIRTIGAMFFPVGLIMIVLTGADLFTSNVMFMSVAALHRRISECGHFSLSQQACARGKTTWIQEA